MGQGGEKLSYRVSGSIGKADAGNGGSAPDPLYISLTDDPAPTSPLIEDERQGDCPCPDEKNDPAKAESEIGLYSHYYTKEE